MNRDGGGWLVEWDGGSESVASPKAGEKFIKGKIAEWDEDAAGRTAFCIVRDGSADHRIAVWQRGDRIAVYQDGQPVGQVTKAGATFSAFVFCVPAPFDWFGGSYESVEAAVDFVAAHGEAPDYMKEDPGTYFLGDWSAK